MALYGNVAIERRYCEDCLQMTLCTKGKRLCCGQTSRTSPQRYERMSEPEGRRRNPPKWAQKDRLEKQQNRCFWCDVEFGSVVLRDGKPIQLRIAWDHYIPYSFSQDNDAVNFVASCHICNGIKSDRCFGTVDEAKAYIAQRRIAKGYL